MGLSKNIFKKLCLNYQTVVAMQYKDRDGGDGDGYESVGEIRDQEEWKGLTGH